MARSLTTHLLPALFDLSELAGGIAVVIDILRASSTIATALANGAKSVVPCESIEAAWAQVESLERTTLLLGGERHGVRIEGFDLGNTPTDYSPERVAARTIYFTTTNGTKALHRCDQAERVLIGSFLNRDAVVEDLQRSELPIHLVCAGTNGAVTLEDCLFAGEVVRQLTAAGDWQLNDSSRISCSLAERWNSDSGSLLAGLQESQGGRNLHRLKLSADVAYCAEQNRLAILPVWNSQRNEIAANPAANG
ncbi:MAG: 2-phosphosulfolactate phosphatase [Rubinisphaera brasiliensis]|uniref:2-phosphosulfolactate phosphatase n=1 Tax=Rubinisphaera brasiliensis TaxID=119 RepID=UPI003919C388